MLKDIKLGFKIMKYGPQVKSNLIVTIMFFAIGLLMLNPFGSNTGVFSNYMGGFYMLYPGIMFHQMVLNVSIPSMVNASSLKKKLQTSIPSMLTLIGTTLGYIVFIVLQLVKQNIHQYTGDTYMEIAASFIFAGFFGMIMQIFAAITYKYLYSSLIVFAVLLGSCAVIDLKSNITEYLSTHLSLPLCIITGYILVLAGSVLCYIISCKLYKKDFDSHVTKLSMSR